MAKKEIEFKAQGYLEKSYIDKEGAWHHGFEFSVKNATDHAKLVLMGRDLNNHLPVLLEVRVKVSQKKDIEKIGKKARASSKIYR